MASNLASKYSQSMREHPYGHAFYEPERASLVRPGTCGYLNSLGQWQPIADLTDEAGLQRDGFDLPKTLIKAKDREHEWGPKASTGVRSKQLDLTAGGSGVATGIPAEASIVYEFKSLKRFGALLMCPSTVYQQGYHHRHPFREWAEENAATILKTCPDAKDEGFWVVTTTYSTDDAWIKAWDQEEHHFALGFSVGAVGTGEIAPSGRFYRGDDASGWTHSKKEGDDDKVVFFSGLHFKYRWLPLGRKSVKEVRNVAPIVIADPLKETPADEDLYQLECDFVGSSEG